MKRRLQNDGWQNVRLNGELTFTLALSMFLYLEDLHALFKTTIIQGKRVLAELIPRILDWIVGSAYLHLSRSTA